MCVFGLLIIVGSVVDTWKKSTKRKPENSHDERPQVSTSDLNVTLIGNDDLDIRYRSENYDAVTGQELDIDVHHQDEVILNVQQTQANHSNISWCKLQYFISFSVLI